MNDEIEDIKKRLERLERFIYNIQKYLINIEEKGDDDDELYIEDIS